jgi:hypothetical protein
MLLTRCPHEFNELKEVHRYPILAYQSDDRLFLNGLLRVNSFSFSWSCALDNLLWLSVNLKWLMSANWKTSSELFIKRTLIRKMVNKSDSIWWRANWVIRMRRLVDNIASNINSVFFDLMLVNNRRWRKNEQTVMVLKRNALLSSQLSYIKDVGYINRKLSLIN